MEHITGDDLICLALILGATIVLSVAAWRNKIQ